MLFEFAYFVIILIILKHRTVTVIQSRECELVADGVPEYQLGGDVQPHLVVLLVVLHKQRPRRHIEEILVCQGCAVKGRGGVIVA